MIGRKFGKLTVLERAGSDKHHNALYICKCDCGTITKPIIASSLRSEKRKSCGCIRGKHHMRNTRLYSIWQGMKARCYKQSHTWFKKYGGRGITVCDEWKDDFQAFYDWAMANGYSDELSIDRINNDGNYEPSNCQWTTQTNQIRNRSIAIETTINGVPKTLQQLSDETGIAYRTLYRRYQNGMRNDDLIKDLDTKKQTRKKKQKNSEEPEV